MTGINVLSSTQKIVVEKASASVAVISAGPIGPAGPPGAAISTQEQLAAVIEALDVITDMTNADIRSKLPGVIKDLARQCRIIALAAKGP